MSHVHVVRSPLQPPTLVAPIVDRYLQHPPLYRPSLYLHLLLLLPLLLYLCLLLFVCCDLLGIFAHAQLRLAALSPNLQLIFNLSLISSPSLSASPCRANRRARNTAATAKPVAVTMAILASNRTPCWPHSQARRAYCRPRELPCPLAFARSSTGRQRS